MQKVEKMTNKITVKEAAAILGVSGARIYALLKNGTIGNRETGIDPVLLEKFRTGPRKGGRPRIYGKEE